MLWYRSWLETRWRFVIGLALLPLSAAGSVLAYPHLIKLLPLASQVDANDAIGRRVLEAAEIMGTYRGYIWAQWFAANMTQQWTLFAVLLGTGGLLAQSSGGGALFTLSLPATRDRIVGVRAATGLAELLALALAPALLLPVLSPAVGQSYSLVDALMHALFIFIAGSMFFSLAFFLSSVFSDVWRPVLLVACVAMPLAFFEEVIDGFSRYSVFGLMSGEQYFQGEGVPWLGLILSVVVSAVLLSAATRNIARQDF
jgi:ABC-type transport system involved in multi-copper enzyme maturation permease subunit